MARREREFAGSDRMSEHEALMWNVEKDPWLNASGASLTILDKPADFEYLRRTLRSAITRMPRLMERVVPGFGRVSTPAWAPDPEFDLDYHLQHLELTGDGTERELFDLATRLYNEPLDRTRPLWRFVSITGVEGGRGAIYVIMHHVIADGIGQMRMAEMYQQLSRSEPPPADVDLEAFIASAIAASDTKESGGDTEGPVTDAFRDSVAHLTRRQLGIARRILGEVVLWPADPARMGSSLASIGEAAAAAMSQLAPAADDESHGSPLWKHRSRHRHLESVSVSVADLKAAAKTIGGSLNDAFLAGLAEGAHRYHAERESPAQTFNSSFVLSTRTDTKAGGNAFTPVPIRLPAGPLTIQERLQLTHDAALAARERAQRTGGLGGLSGIANLLPTSVVTRAARAQGARIDFATSNLRGAPVELFCAGGRVERTVVMGPVAGTGANITAMSHMDNFEIGLFMDPEAIADPRAFRDNVEQAFADMFVQLANQPEPTTAPKKTEGKKTTTTKTGAKKTTVRKATTKKAAAKKATTKKAAAKKATTKKTTAAKKTTGKKTAAKKATTKKAAAKKATAKKTAAKKKPAAKKKSTTTRAAPKKAATKKR